MKNEKFICYTNSDLDEKKLELISVGTEKKKTLIYIDYLQKDIDTMVLRLKDKTWMYSSIYRLLLSGAICYAATFVIPFSSFLKLSMYAGTLVFNIFKTNEDFWRQQDEIYEGIYNHSFTYESHEECLNKLRSLVHKNIVILNELDDLENRLKTELDMIVISLGYNKDDNENVNNEVIDLIQNDFENEETIESHQRTRKM